MPVRLEKKQEKKQSELMALLDSDIVLKIKFYVLIIGAMALFIAFCFMIKPQTYGFL